MKYFTRAMIRTMHSWDLSHSEWRKICNAYNASVEKIAGSFTPGLATLADSRFHDCENITIPTGGTQVVIQLEGTRCLYSTDERLVGRHELVFKAATLHILEPLHDPDYWLYEEVGRKGHFWTYSAIMEWGQIAVEFRDCEVKLNSRA